MLEIAARALTALRNRFASEPQSWLARKMRHAKLTYLSRARFHRLETVLDSVLKAGVSGDLMEFGVALGGSAIVIASRSNDQRAFHGFDVFAMIPPPSGEKDGKAAMDRYETIKSGASQGIGGERYYGYRDDLLESVTAAFAANRLPVDGKRIVLHKGLFEDTWASYGGSAIAFAHIDCDWYDPVRFCLESVAEHLSPGGAIVLDDYHDYGGCKAAVDEFLAKRPDFSFDDGDNVILRKAKA